MTNVRSISLQKAHDRLKDELRPDAVGREEFEDSDFDPHFAPGAYQARAEVADGVLTVRRQRGDTVLSADPRLADTKGKAVPHAGTQPPCEKHPFNGVFAPEEIGRGTNEGPSTALQRTPARTSLMIRSLRRLASQFHRRLPNLLFTRLYLRQIEDLVHNGPRVLCRTAGCVEVIKRLPVRPPFEQLEHPEHPVHRSSNFIAHICEELRLCLCLRELFFETFSP